jgi:GTP diphosphokinase / guanosine-3',5'-bis(diphosphate) 3'-diphosphatase
VSGSDSRSNTPENLHRDAKLVKIADKICHVRDIALSPPTDRPLESRRDYLTWSEKSS